MGSSLPALDEGHWAFVSGPFAKGIGPWTVDRYPPTLDLGQLTTHGRTSAPAHVPTNKDHGPLTFALKDWVFLLATHNGLSGGRIRPNSTLLDGRAPNEDPCSNDECGLMWAITAIAKITVPPGLRA